MPPPQAQTPTPAVDTTPLAPLEGRSFQLVLVATDTPANCDAAHVLGWISHTVTEEPAGNVALPTVVAVDTASISAPFHLPKSEAAAVAQQILAACCAAVDGAANNHEHARVICVAHCPSPMVAYELLAEEPSGPCTAGLIVVNSIDAALPPAPAAIAAVSPAKGGKGAAKAPEPKKAAGKNAKAATPVAEAEDDDRDAFAVELAVLCEGDDGDDEPAAGNDSTAIERETPTPAPADAQQQQQQQQQATPSGADVVADAAAAERIPADFEKQALFAAMELLVVDTIPNDWSASLHDEILPMLKQVALAGSQYDAWVASQPTTKVRRLEQGSAAQVPAVRGPWGQYKAAVTDRSGDASGAAAALNKSAAKSQPGSPSKHGSNAPSPTAPQPRVAAHTVAPSAAIMAPGGAVAATAGIVTSHVVDQVQREAAASAPVRQVVRVERRHIPRPTEPSEKSDDGNVNKTEDASGLTTSTSEGAVEATPATIAEEEATRSVEKQSAFITVHVPVGPVMEVPAESRPEAASTFEDVWAAVSTACSWGGNLSLPSENGQSNAAPPPMRPTTQRRATTTMIMGDSADSMRLPSPPTSSHAGGDRGRSSAKVATALLNTFGRDIVETRVQAAVAASRWERAVAIEEAAVARDTRGEDASIRLVRAAKAADGSRTAGAMLPSTQASPGGTLTFELNGTRTTGNGEVAAATADATEVRRIAQETVTSYERSFALLQARAQTTLDRIRRAQAAAAEENAPHMPPSAGFAGSITRRSEGLNLTASRTSPTAAGGRMSRTSQRGGGRSPTNAGRSPSPPSPTSRAPRYAPSAISAADFVFMQSVTPGDAQRIVTDSEAPVDGAYITSHVVLDPAAVTRSLVQPVRAAQQQPASDATENPRSPKTGHSKPTSRGGDSRPSSSGSVLKASNDGAPSASSRPVAIVCSAPTAPADGFRATSTVLLHGAPPPPAAYSLMKRDADDSTEASPLQRWSARWLNEPAPRLWSKDANASCEAATQEKLAWYRRDGSVVVASATSLNRERRVTTRIADVCASLSVVAANATDDDDEGAAPGQFVPTAMAFSATFADGTLLQLRRGDGADEADATRFGVTYAYLSTRNGATARIVPGDESAAVLLRRSVTFPDVVDLLAASGDCMCRLHVEETERTIDRRTGRVVRRFEPTPDGIVVTDVLEADMRRCTIAVHAGATTYLVTRPDGSRVGRLLADDGATTWNTKLAPLEVQRARDVERRCEIVSRADGVYRIIGDGERDSVVVFRDGTKIATNFGGSGDNTRTRAALPRLQVESPVPPGTAAMPVVAVDSEHRLVVFAADGADTLREDVSRFGRDELVFARRGGTDVRLDLETQLVAVRPWTVESLLGHDPRAESVPKGARRELEALLVGTHVFGLGDGGYRHVDLGLAELSLSLATAIRADISRPFDLGAGMVQPMRALHHGITVGASFLTSVSERVLDLESTLLQIAGQKKVLPPRVAASRASRASSGLATDASTIRSESAGSELSPTGNRFAQRLRILANPIVSQYNLLEYNTVKAREAARRAEDRGAASASRPALSVPRPLLFVYFDDGTAARLLSGPDLAPLLRHAMGTSAVTLSRSSVGGEPGVQQISYLLDPARDPADELVRLAHRGLVAATKSTVLAAQNNDPHEAPPAQLLAASGGDGASVLRDIDAAIPRGMLPPAHVVAARQSAKAEVCQPILLTFTRFAPLAPAVRRQVINDEVARADREHASSLYSAALQVPDYRPPDQRTANEDLAAKHADKVARFKAQMLNSSATAAGGHDGDMEEDAQEEYATGADGADASYGTAPNNASKKQFSSTASASQPIVAKPGSLHFGDLARGYSYQMMLTLENTTSGPVTFTAKRVAAKLAPGTVRHPIEIQAGRGVIPAAGSTRIGVVCSASVADPDHVSVAICIESNASRQSLLVKASATLVGDGASAAQHADPRHLVDRLPTSVKLLGVAH